MDRRMFLQLAAGAAAAGLERNAFGISGGAQPVKIKIAIRQDKKLMTIPASFTGLGYEASSVSAAGLLTAKNKKYVQMVKTLGSQGVLRIGGNNSDYATFVPQGQPVSSPKSSVIDKRNLHDLKGFLDATGWQLIWGLNLGFDSHSGNLGQMVDEAAAVSRIMKGRLIAFEIGNEPDLYVHEGHRQGSYTYENYLADFRRYKQAIRAKVKDAPFAGPDAAGSDEWVGRFAADEGHDLKLLTEHYYRGGAGSPHSTLDELLHPDIQLELRLARLHQDSEQAHVPFRICETNSFSGGGKPGVSDTFGAALWTLDYMFRLAAYGAAGVNIETGMNQFGVISVYSPLGDDQHGNYTATPSYYGMLAFAQASRGGLVAVDAGTAGINLSCYAVRSENGEVALTIINKDGAKDAEVEIAAAGFSKAQAMRLTAPSLESREQVTLGGSAVDAEGKWMPGGPEQVHISDGAGRMQMRSASAAIVTFTV